MEKKSAIQIFGSSLALGKALGISAAAISQWPKDLTTRRQDEVVGAAIRLGKITPEQAKELIKDAGQRDKRD